MLPLRVICGGWASSTKVLLLPREMERRAAGFPEGARLPLF